MNTPDKGKRILEKGGTWVPIDWSPDDKKLLIINYVSANESYCYTLEIATGDLTQINPSKEKIAYGLSSLWAKNENGLYMTSDEGSEFLRLRYYDLERKEFTTLTSNIPCRASLISAFDSWIFVTKSECARPFLYSGISLGIAKYFSIQASLKSHKMVP